MRNVLIACGCLLGVVLLCVVACLGVGFFALNSAEGSIGAYYGVVATGQNPADIGFACSGSQAETYAQDLYDRYGADNSVSITIDNFTEQSDGVWSVSGTIDNESYSATVTLGDESGFLGIFGNCVESVNELN